TIFNTHPLMKHPSHTTCAMPPILDVNDCIESRSPAGRARLTAMIFCLIRSNAYPTSSETQNLETSP
ncbi:4106_t:CDS:2, partial [Dentiscutata erythropus]